MKTIFSSCLLMVIMSLLSHAQNVPQGMKYQAVARDLSGTIMADQNIDLKMSLVSDGREFYVYSELHQITTNQLGLFEITIGEGQAIEGIFSDIPWSSEEVWLEIALASPKTGRYETLSSSRLMTVPYAFHAGTAGDITFDGINGDDLPENCNGGVPSNVWSQKGNCNSNPNQDKLGTTDCADLVIVTDNQERLRITCAGNLEVGGNFTIGNVLTV